MEKLDRLGWAAGFTFRSYGLTVGVRTTEPGVLARLRRSLPVGAREVQNGRVDILFSFFVPKPASRPGVRRYNIVYGGQNAIARAIDLDEAFAAFDLAIMEAVATYARRDIFVHAGVVGWHGRAIVIPGQSRTGKTTLVRAFVRAGAAYYSDEFAVIDPSGHVKPYAREPVERGDGGTRTHVPLTELESAVGRRAIPVSCVLVTEFHEGSHWRPRSITHGEAALDLLSNTLPARHRPAEALSRFRLLLQNAVSLRGARGEADEVVRAVISRLA